MGGGMSDGWIRSETREEMNPTDESWFADFILANTKLLAPPLVPEIRLHLAEESLPIWQKTEEELGEMNVPPPFWAFAWAGGQALARYVLDNPHEVAGKSVFDLGTGSGLTAIAARMAGASRVLGADIDRIAVVAAQINARVNGVDIEITDRNTLEGSPGGHGVVLVGDVFYERELAERVLTYVRTAAARGARVLIGDPRRNYFPNEGLQQVAEYRVPVTRDLEDALIKRTAVWALT